MSVLAAFARHGVQYVLIGSMAMAAQGLIRATRDMDVFVAPDPANVERLKAALRELFADPSIEEIRSQDLEGDYPALQYTPPEGDYWIDILSRLGEAIRYSDLEAEVLEVKGRQVLVPLASMGIARFSFAELCEAPLGTHDYLRIAHTYHTVMIDDIPVMARDRRNPARRFINLIDTLYDNKVCLIASAAAEPDDLCEDDGAKKAFARTASRLIEMRSEEYLMGRAIRGHTEPETESLD